MNVIGKHTTNISVTLDERTQREVILKHTGNPNIYLDALLNRLKDSINIPQDAYVNKQGQWETEDEVYGGSHSWYNTKEYRTATEEELKFLDDITNIRHAFMVLKLVDK